MKECVIPPFKRRKEWYCSPPSGTNDDHWFPWVVNNIIPPSVWREEWHIFCPTDKIGAIFSAIQVLSKFVKMLSRVHQLIYLIQPIQRYKNWFACFLSKRDSTRFLSHVRNAPGFWKALKPAVILKLNPNIKFWLCERKE